MSRAAILGLGGALLTLGAAWIFLSFGIVFTFWPSGNGPALIGLELVATGLITAGMGLLIYGAARSSETISQ